MKVRISALVVLLVPLYISSPVHVYAFSSSSRKYTNNLFQPSTRLYSKQVKDHDTETIHTNLSNNESNIFEILSKDFISNIQKSVFTCILASLAAVTPIPSQTIASASFTDTIPTANFKIDTEKPLSAQPLTQTGINKSRYYTIMSSNNKDDIQFANERLLDHVVGTINTQYYDNTGGNKFTTKDMYDRWKVLRTYAKEGIGGVQYLTSGSSAKIVKNADSNGVANTSRDAFIPQLFLVDQDKQQVQVQKHHLQYEDVQKWIMPSHAFDGRDEVVQALRWIVSTLDDPYSKYMTREDLEKELKVKDDGFLGLGAIVEVPSTSKTSDKGNTLDKKSGPSSSNSNSKSFVSLTRVENLPSVTAIAPDSPAERAGIVVGDRIAAVGSDKFIGLGRDEILKRMSVYTGAENYVGYPELTIAKPMIQVIDPNMSNDDELQVNVATTSSTTMNPQEKEELYGYKLSRVKLPTATLEPYKPFVREHSDSEENRNGFPSVVLPAIAADTITKTPKLNGGDNIVHWELLTNDDSIFGKYRLDTSSTTDKIGYIRLTRFSRLSTSGYTKAVEELEKAGAQSYIIDVRNNYGGIIQESMLTAATLLRDPHTVLCYTLNSRGGFTPHDAEEYIVDPRYPGYFLSSEPRSATFDQVKRDDPDYVDPNNGWVPPSSYASIHEQRMKRNYKRPTGISTMNPFNFRASDENLEEIKQRMAQKKLVVLMNEGTASAAEVFVASLHDNGRTVATVGTKTYGKGLIQHTFPLPDGGGLRLTVAEYLTPALQHVTKVGGAMYENGRLIGGGIRPDIYCPSTQGIPSNVGADICVGLAVDALEEASSNIRTSMDEKLALDGNGLRRRTFTQGIVRVSDWCFF